MSFCWESVKLHFFLLPTHIIQHSHGFIIWLVESSVLKQGIFHFSLPWSWSWWILWNWNTGNTHIFTHSKNPPFWAYRIKCVTRVGAKKRINWLTFPSIWVHFTGKFTVFTPKSQLHLTVCFFVYQKKKKKNSRAWICHFFLDFSHIL